MSFRRPLQPWLAEPQISFYRREWKKDDITKKWRSFRQAALSSSEPNFPTSFSNFWTRIVHIDAFLPQSPRTRLQHLQQHCCHICSKEKQKKRNKTQKWVREKVYDINHMRRAFVFQFASHPAFFPYRCWWESKLTHRRHACHKLARASLFSSLSLMRTWSLLTKWVSVLRARMRRWD